MKLTPKQERVKKAVEYLKNYINTYDSQYGYLDYSDAVIIDDILYGLGVALDDKKYQMGSGFKEFKKVLRDHLKTN